MQDQLLSIRIKSFGISLIATALIAISGYVLSADFSSVVTEHFGTTVGSTIALLVVRELASHFRNKYQLGKVQNFGRLDDGEPIVLI